MIVWAGSRTPLEAVSSATSAGSARSGGSVGALMGPIMAGGRHGSGAPPGARRDTSRLWRARNSQMGPESDASSGGSLRPGRQNAGPDRLGGQHTEEVEIR